MHYLETAVEIAREAGALLANYFERRVPFELKGEFDLVTEADRASEKLVVERLRSYFPSHTIVAEEGGGHEQSSEYRWFVDPLDGTTNFAHGFPMFNVTLGLERAGELVAGVVYDPIRQEMFTAERGARRVPEQPAHPRFAAPAAGRQPGLHRLSQPQAAPQRQHPLLLPAGDGLARRAAHRVGGHRPGLRGLRPAGLLLGIRPEALGHGGRDPPGAGSRRPRLRHARRPAQRHRFRTPAGRQ